MGADSLCLALSLFLHDWDKAPLLNLYLTYHGCECKYTW